MNRNKSFEYEFWDLYNSGRSAGEELENIASELNIQLWDDNDVAEVLDEDEYEKIMRTYYERNGDFPISDDDMLDRIISLLDNNGFYVRTFEDAGLLTRNLGFVVYNGDKRYEFALLGSWK